MTDQAMFDDTTPKTEDNKTAVDPASSNTNPFADKLNEIVNDKGEPKYKDIEAALEALKHSQDFIKTLQNESQQTKTSLQEMQSELEKRKSVEDVVKSLTNQNTQSSESKPSTEGKDNALDEDKVRNMLESLLNEKTSSQKKEDNLSLVVRTISETHGEKAKSFIQQRAKELNTTPQELQKLAEDNPNIALSLLGGGTSTSNSPSTQTTNPPRYVQKSEELERPKQRLITGGASNKDVMDNWRKIKEHTMRKHNVEQ